MANKKDPLGAGANILNPADKKKMMTAALSVGRSDPEPPQQEPAPSPAAVPTPAPAAPPVSSLPEAAAPDSAVRKKAEVKPLLTEEQIQYCSTALAQADWSYLFNGDPFYTGIEVSRISIRISADLAYRLDKLTGRLMPNRDRGANFYRKMAAVFVQVMEEALDKMPPDHG